MEGLFIWALHGQRSIGTPYFAIESHERAAQMCDITDIDIAQLATDSSWKQRGGLL